MDYRLPHRWDGRGLAYDPPFVPRYSVPEGFQRALSYEGQLHWLAGSVKDALEYVDGARSCFVVEARPSDRIHGSDIAEWPGTDRHVHVATPGKDEHDGVPDDVRTDDVVLCLVDVYEDACPALVVGTLVSACRCNAPEDDDWLIHVWHVVRNYWNDIVTLSYRVTNVENRTTQVENRVTKVEGDVTNVANRVANVENRTTQVENRVTNVEGSVTNLAQTVNNISQSQTTVDADLTAVKKAISDIVGKVYGGGTVDWTTGNVSWNASGTVPVGNINVYSQPGDPATSVSNFILTHAGANDRDLWFKEATSG